MRAAADGDLFPAESSARHMTYLTPPFLLVACGCLAHFPKHLPDKAGRKVLAKLPPRFRARREPFVADWTLAAFSRHALLFRSRRVIECLLAVRTNARICAGDCV
ncbi:hypothetical protein K437DRAFT_77752, partial [Tilletiaria anomala UBC 951]